MESGEEINKNLAGGVEFNFSKYINI